MLHEAGNDSFYTIEQYIECRNALRAVISVIKKYKDAGSMLPIVPSDLATLEQFEEDMTFTIKRSAVTIQITPLNDPVV